MKCCFLLHRQFAYIGHYLAQELKEKYGIEEFCGYVYVRSSYAFLKSQKDINYSTLLLDEDIHEQYKHEKIDREYLRYLEKEFGLPSLWPYLVVDRIFMSNQLIREYPYDKPSYTHEEMLRMLQVRARAIIKFIDTEKPDILFCIPPGAMGSMLLYHIAKKRGVKTLTVAPSNIRDRYILSESYSTFTAVDERFRTHVAELKASPHWKEAMTFLEEFRRKPTPYFEKATPSSQPVTRMKQLKFLNPINAFRSLTVFLRSVHHHYITNERRDYTYISPWDYLKDLLKRKTRNIIGAEDLYEPFDPNEDFAYFPLHYEPELSLLLLAPYYTDQISLIRQIARSLPAQFKLIVKEHPVMAEYRPRSYYQTLKKIPNVKLISPTINSFDITPYAKLILTITGTVGWEAALLKKPVISFGHQNFNALSMVKLCEKIEQLPSLILEQLHAFTYNEEEIIAYIAALYENSAVLNLKNLWEEETDHRKKREGIKPLADLLARMIQPVVN